MKKTEKEAAEWKGPRPRDRVIRQMRGVQEEEEQQREQLHEVVRASYTTAFHKLHDAFSESLSIPRDVEGWSASICPVTTRKQARRTHRQHYRIEPSSVIYLGGEPGERVLVVSHTEDDPQLAIRHRIAQAFADLEQVRSVHVHESGDVTYVYTVVDSWNFEDVRPVYERELSLRDEFPDVPLELKALLQGGERRIPGEAELLMKR